MQILFILVYLLIAFIGYAVGRVTHIYWGYIKSPHHWIYGLILIILGLIFYKNFLGLVIFSFGVGHFISDFNDFLNLKFYGRDEEGIKKFWGVD
jgi:putative Mn2+ efflux pump MntP